MSMPSTPLVVPPWYYRLPIAPGGKRAIVVAPHVIGAYCLTGATDAALEFVFEAGRVQIQIRRRVIDEALADADLTPDRRLVISESLVELQRRGGMLVDGGSPLSPAMQRAHAELTVLLRASLPALDAMVLADAIVTRVPLLTRPPQGGAALGRAVRSDLVQRFLGLRALQTDPAAILIE